MSLKDSKLEEKFLTLVSAFNDIKNDKDNSVVSKEVLEERAKQVTDMYINTCEYTISSDEKERLLEVAREYILKNSIRYEVLKETIYTQGDNIPGVNKLLRDLEKDYPTKEGQETPFDLLNDHLQLCRMQYGEVSAQQMKKGTLTWAAIMNYVVKLPPQSIKRNGLLFSLMQSGKTERANALMQVAPHFFDIIVLFTNNNSGLRNQCQERIEERVIGYNSTDVRKKFAIFNISSKREAKTFIKGEKKRTDFCMMTTREKNGDNLKIKGNPVLLPDSNKTYILVIKKNINIVTKVLEWMYRMGFNKSNRVLFLDDEADIVSINSKEFKTSRNVSSQMMQMIHTFEQYMYIAITATPMAIFFGQSIDSKNSFYPDYVQVCKQAPGYISPYRIFSLSKSEYGKEINPEKFSFIVNTSDYKDRIPLHQSVKYFLLTGGIMHLRKKINQDHIMMIHTHRLNSKHSNIANEVASYLAEIKDIVLGRKKDDGFWADMFEMYVEQIIMKREDNIQVYKDVLQEQGILENQKDIYVEKAFSNLENATLNQIKKYVKDFYKELINKNESRDFANGVYILNSKKNSLLPYSEYPNGLKAIIIGGDILGRGLSLQGLRVTYFDRVIKQADVGAQDERFLGHLTEIDLIKIFMSRERIQEFEKVTAYLFDTQYLLKKQEWDSLEKYTQKTLKILKHNGVGPTSKMSNGFLTKEGKSYIGLTSKAQWSSQEEYIKEQQKFIGGFLQKLEENVNVKDIRGHHIYEQVDIDQIGVFLSNISYENQNDIAKFVEKLKTVYNTFEIVVLNNKKGREIPLNISQNIGAYNSQIICDSDMKLHTKYNYTGISQPNKAINCNENAIQLLKYFVIKNLEEEKKKSCKNNHTDEWFVEKEAEYSKMLETGIINKQLIDKAYANAKKEIMEHNYKNDSTHKLSLEYNDRMISYANKNKLTLFIKILDVKNICNEDGERVQLNINSNSYLISYYLLGQELHAMSDEVEYYTNSKDIGA